MGIIFAIIGALLVGVAARFLYPGKVKLGWLESLALGFGGGLVGKSLAFVLGMGFAGGIVTSIIGALILIFIYRKFIEKDKKVSKLKK